MTLLDKPDRGQLSLLGSECSRVSLSESCDGSRSESFRYPPRAVLVLPPFFPKFFPGPRTGAAA